MTRNIPEPSPDKTTPSPGEQLVYAAVKEALGRASLHRTTGKFSIVVDVNQGGPRAVRIITDEGFRLGNQSS